MLKFFQGLHLKLENLLFKYLLLFVENTEEKAYEDHEYIIHRLEQASVINNHSLTDITRLEVLTDSIDTYTELLRNVNAALKGEADFPKEDLVLRLVKVCNFYKGRHGEFVPLAVSRSKLIGEMIKVLRLHYELSLNNYHPGWLSYALRRSETVIMNIDSLSLQMIELNSRES